MISGYRSLRRLPSKIEQHTEIQELRTAVPVLPKQSLGLLWLERPLFHAPPQCFPYSIGSVFESAWGSRQQMERLGEQPGGDLCTDLLGEEDAFGSLGGEVLSIGRDQDIPDNMVLLPPLLLSVGS